MKFEEKYPFKKGDEVIDDNGEIGYCLESYFSAEWSSDGKLVSWRLRIHYRWDQPSYGKVRSVSEGEITMFRPA